MTTMHANAARTRTRRNFVASWLAMMLTTFALCATSLHAKENDARRPSVLFVNVKPHASYVAAPLHELGLELDYCEAGELEKKLADGRFNVIVLGATDDQKLKPVVEGFLERGGGLFLPAPYGHMGRAANWFPTPEWGEGFGARMRWHVVEDANPDNIVTDIMGLRHSWSDRIAPPFNQNAAGVLTLMGRSGMWPPLAFDFNADWQVVVRWAESVQPKPVEQNIGRFEAYWWTDQPLTERSGLLGVRQVGKGRLALCGFTDYWLFSSPPNCPTIEVMLSAGAGNKSSDWLQVVANTFKWLAEPSLAEGMGGARTPEALLFASDVIPIPPLIDWTGVRPVVRDPQKPLVLPAMADMQQVRGLVGARTELSGYRGTVAEYAAEARKAGLDYLVFLENALNMDEAKFNELLRQCGEASDGLFAAIPGLTIEDAQGNHFFYIGDNLKFPTSDMVLPDGRLNTTDISRTEAIFKYGWQYMNYRVLIGWYNHDKNHTSPVDYKLYNAFPIYSFEDGKQFDSALDDYLYRMGWGGCHTPFALELMSGPEQVAKRAINGWKTVGKIAGEYGDGTYVNQESNGVTGLRERWKTAPSWYPPYLYISNGPEILCWTPQNNCVVPKGDWWRPDLWQYRARLHVRSEVGLKSVTIHDGDRGVFRRWLPNGQKSFDHTMVLANNLQRDLVLEVEDMDGKRAISMELWNRNTMFDQVICGDRCNFLGTAFLRRKDGTAIWHRPGFQQNLGLSPSKGEMNLTTFVQPASGLSPFPTLPIDGQPQSVPTPTVQTVLYVPGEHREVHSAPSTYLISPEYGVGQGNFAWAYDPAEYGVTKTPLGHDYKQVDASGKARKQGEVGKNAWTSWFHLVPTKLMDGWVRIHATQATLGEVRFGKMQVRLTMKDDVPIDPDKGWDFLRVNSPVQIYVDGNPLPVEAGKTAQGQFGRGTIALFETPGGTAILCGEGDRLSYRWEKNSFWVAYDPPENVLKKGETFEVAVPFLGTSNRLSHRQILKTLADFGLLKPGSTGYPSKIKRGRTLDSYGVWNVAAENGAFEATLPQVDLTSMISVQVDNLNDRWTAFLQNHKRPMPNFRPIPVRDGRGYALLDPTDVGADAFIGHPVTCDNPNVMLQVSWMEPGKWFVEAHNDSDKKVSTTVASDPAWKIFKLREKIALAPGSSQVWEVKE